MLPSASSALGEDDREDESDPESDTDSALDDGRGCVDLAFEEVRGREE